MSWVTWPRWPPCPYMVKTLKNLLLQNQLTNDLETWYVALCMWVLPRVFKLSPWVDLDIFYAKVKFGHIGFYMGKSENYLFFRTIAAFGLKLAWSIQLNEFMKLGEYSRSRSFFDLGQRSLRFQSSNSWAIWNQSSYESLKENRNENKYKWVGSHDQDGRHAHIW